MLLKPLPFFPGTGFQGQHHCGSDKQGKVWQRHDVPRTLLKKFTAVKIWGKSKMLSPFMVLYAYACVPLDIASHVAFPMNLRASESVSRVWTPFTFPSCLPDPQRKSSFQNAQLHPAPVLGKLQGEEPFPRSCLSMESIGTVFHLPIPPLTSVT